MNIKNIIAIVTAFVFAAVFTSCRKEVKFNLDNKDNGVVLNSLLKNDSTVAARITYLKGLNQTANTEPESASVKLYENEVFLEELKPTLINGYKYYVSSRKLNIGNSYKITAEVPGFDMVEGTDVIPNLAEVTNAKLTETQNANEGNSYNLDFTLNDEVGKPNYYRIRVFGSYTGWWSPNTPDTTFIRAQYFSFKNADMGETDLDGYSVSYEEYYFTDDVFNGAATKDIQLKFYPYNGGMGTSDTSTYTLEITSLTQSSYNYFKTKSDAKNNDNDPFTEPSVIYSNIKNGLGIVGGIAHKRVNLKL